MKKVAFLAGAAALMLGFTACNGGKKAEAPAAAPVEAKAEPAVPEYKLLDLPTVDWSKFPKDKD